MFGLAMPDVINVAVELTEREIMSCVDGPLHIIRCGFVIDSFVNLHTLPPLLTFLPVILSFSFFRWLLCHIIWHIHGEMHSSCLCACVLRVAI